MKCEELFWEELLTKCSKTDYCIALIIIEKLVCMYVCMFVNFLCFVVSRDFEQLFLLPLQFHVLHLFLTELLCSHHAILTQISVVGHFNKMFSSGQ